MSRQTANKLPSTAGAALEFLEGDLKGEVISLRKRRMTIGRSQENDIVIPSDSVSRNHAKILRGEEGEFFIADNGSKNGVLVNGEQVESKIPLKEGDLIQLGTYLIRFGGQLEAPDEGEESEHAVAAPKKGRSPARGRKALRFAEGLNTKRIVLYGGVAILLVVVLMSNEEPTSETPAAKQVAETAEEQRRPTLVPPSSPDTSVPGLDDPLGAAEESLGRLGWKNPQLREAEQYFRRGQREFLSKNYPRAIQAFQTALTFDRNHPLAMGYLQLSNYEANKEATGHYELGVKYFQTLQYARAKYHFEQVITLESYLREKKLGDDSRKYLALCEKMLRAAELFP